MVRNPEKTIITAAITGSDTFPTQTPYLPITPEEIAESAYQAYIILYWQYGSGTI